MKASRRWSRWAARLLWLGLMVAVLCGTALRLAFLVISHPHVDEYSSIWAAMNILQKGAPVLPSGFVYLQGLLFTYLDALFIAILGFSEWTARLPSLLASALAIPLVFVWGRRAFGPWAGVLASSLTALAPASIVWGGRARMYALQQVLLTLALYAFYIGYVESRQESGKTLWRWVFAVAFAGAMLSQTVAILVVPALLLSLFVWRQQWWHERKAYPPLVVFVVSVPVAVSFNYLGGPVSSNVGRSFIDLSLPWRLKPEFFFRESLWTWPGTLFTVLFIAGFVLLAINVRKRSASAKGLLYVYILFSVTLLAMILLIGESWQRPRYLTMIQPVQDLLMAGVLFYIWILIGRCRTTRCQTVLAVFLWLGLMLIYLPPSLALIGPAEPAYDEAFYFVEAHWREEDAIVGPLPAIPGVYLSRCDGYLLQNVYEEYLVWDDGRPVDRWTGAPLIDTIASFEEVFTGTRRIWFVIDDTRWEQRYTPEFRDFVLQTMVAAYEAYGVTVYQRSEIP